MAEREARRVPALPPVEHPDRPLGHRVALEDVLAVVLELDVRGAAGHDAGHVSVPALGLVPLHLFPLGLEEECVTITNKNLAVLFFSGFPFSLNGYIVQYVQCNLSLNEVAP